MRNEMCRKSLHVYNTKTGELIFRVEGYMSISNNNYGELVCTIKTECGCKTQYIYLNKDTMYVIEDLTESTESDDYDTYCEYNVAVLFVLMLVPVVILIILIISTFHAL